MAIQQHPLPQDISNYRFRLIGDMTIKQFASLGISIVLAIITYSLPLPFFFKYPISFFLVVLGVGMAFVPVQGRPLDVWIIAFIKSIYSPTQYVWKHNSELPSPQPSTSASMPQTHQTTVTPPSNTPTLTNTRNTPAINSNSPTPELPITVPETDPRSSTSSATSPKPAVPPTPSPVVNSQPEPISHNLPTEQNQPISQLPIPFTPTTPNTLVGLTINSQNRILEGVLVEIKKNGLTVRATKSNKLGQFMFARPLENGIFQIFAEKEGLSFAPYSLELTGDIVKPLKIQTTNS